MGDDVMTIAISLSGLKTRKQFIRLMHETFQFPDYFGFNLDALDECMRDLSWMPSRTIRIRFMDLGKIQPLSLRTLIEAAVSDYQAYWHHSPDRPLSVKIQVDR